MMALEWWYIGYLFYSLMAWFCIWDDLVENGGVLVELNQKIISNEKTYNIP
jgi:hypothetical protein